MTICPLTLAKLPAGEFWDRSAARRLFGSDDLPTLDVEMARLHTVALAMVGVATLSGVQRKLSVGLDAARMTLRVGAAGRQFILMPPTDRFPGLPANEHVTMRIAARCGLPVPEHGLLHLADGTLAYIVARFDRPVTGGKLQVEDLCSLAGQYPADKYRGSAELCARLVQRHASAPGIALRDLYRQLLFAWWTGNGDLHLKNLAILTTRGGEQRLSPAYDLVNTRLLLPDDALALPVGGKQQGLTARTWREFAAYCRLPARAAQGLAAGFVEALPDACGLVERSFLAEDQRDGYRGLIEERAAVLRELAG